MTQPTPLSAIRYSGLNTERRVQYHVPTTQHLRTQDIWQKPISSQVQALRWEGDLVAFIHTSVCTLYSTFTTFTIHHNSCHTRPMEHAARAIFVTSQHSKFGLHHACQAHRLVGNISHSLVARAERWLVRLHSCRGPVVFEQFSDSLENVHNSPS